MTLTQYYTATTLDGFIADEHHSLDWLFEVRPRRRSRLRVHGGSSRGVGAMAMGANTYRWVVDHEDLLHHPERWDGATVTRPCWVFSHGELPQVPGRADLRSFPETWLPSTRR